ncbi:PAS domain-containing protein [Methylocella sp.]|uniref:PAS domain-containing protein n=1 Tax=Methylocella sp. TaxID=1978226 RepID=UPI0035B30AC5
MRLEIFCTAVLGIAFLAVLGGWWDGGSPLGLQLAGLAAVAAAFSVIILTIAASPFASAAGPPDETREGSGAADRAPDVLRGLQGTQIPQNAPADSAVDDCDSRLLIDRIEEIVFKIDAGGQLVFLNASRETSLDHPLSASLGKPLMDFAHPEARPVAETQLMALARGERDSCHVEVRMTAKTGTSCWMELRARSTSSVRGERSSVVGTLADISRMKRTEASLRANRRSLSMLLSNVPGMVYRCKNDRNWSFDFASDGCVDVTGYEPYEIVGDSELSYIEIVHPDDRTSAWEFVRRQVALRRKFQLVYRIVTRSGQVRWVWEQGKGVFSSTGEILALEGFVTDIADDGEDEIVRGFEKLLRDW